MLLVIQFVSVMTDQKMETFSLGRLSMDIKITVTRK